MRSSSQFLLYKTNGSVHELSCSLFTSHPYLSHHLVCSGQHVRWDRQTDLLRGFQIDDELELRRLLHGKIGGLGSLQDLVHICSGTPVQVDNVRAVAHKTPSLYIFWKRVYRREPAFYCEVCNLFSLSVDDGARQHENRLRTPFGRCSKCGLNIFSTSYVEKLKLYAKCSRDRFHLL